MLLQNLETKWRYVFVLVGALVAGGIIGNILANIYLHLVHHQSINGNSIFLPWVMEYSVGDIERHSHEFYTGLGINVAAIVALAFVGITSVYRGALTQYDDAHFQTKAEIKRNRMTSGFDHNGFVYGKLGSPKSDAPYISAEPDRFPHAIMIAPTGRGKGVGFVLPNLLHFAGSAIVLDVKGENFEKTAIHRQKGLENKIWYFAPFEYVDAPAPEGAKSTARVTRTHRFNPLARIAAMVSTDEQYTALNTLADLFLIVEGDNAKGFFQAGKRLFVAACLYAIEQGKPHLGYASEILGGGGDRANNFRRYAEMTAIPIVSRTFMEMAGETQKIVDSYISVINGAGFELWSDPSVVRATSESDFDFSTFRREAQTLYIAVQSEHLKTLAPLIRLLFADAIASLQRREPGPDEPLTVMFLMDEFDQLGRQPLVLQSIKTIRSFNGHFFIITQSIAGLESRNLYGIDDRRALVAGAGIQIYMTPQDERTAQVLSEALGKNTIVSVSESQSRIRKLDDSANISRRSEERALISPSELLRFPLDEVLILAEGQYPIRANHIRYYEDRHFAPIDQARKGHKLPYPPLDNERKRPVAKLSGLSKKPPEIAQDDSAKAALLNKVSGKNETVMEQAKKAVETQKKKQSRFAKRHIAPGREASETNIVGENAVQREPTKADAEHVSRMQAMSAELDQKWNAQSHGYKNV